MTDFLSLPVRSPQGADRPATSADVAALAAELRQLRESLAWLARVPELFAPPPEPLDRHVCDGADMVTLDQMAALVHRSKRSLERYRRTGMPEPRTLGRRGQPSLYAWVEVRPWLEATFGLLMPEEYPAARRPLR